MQVFVTGGERRHQALSPVEFAAGGSSMTVADTIAVDAEMRYQPILGFGAALTDSSCYLISRMDPTARQKFLSDTYSPQAMGLNMGRAAIGSSDYSRSLFNYDDVAGDTAMKHFSIEHDEEYILPTLHEIRTINPDLFLLASPWSPPGWMKTYGSMLGGWMSAPFLGPYAHYLALFLQSYAKAGIRVDAITSQNEVETDQNGNMPAAYWTPDMEEDFIRDHLGPVFQKEGIKTQIWLLDHNYNLWKRVRWQLRDAKLRAFVSGVAWHGYVGTPDMMSRLHDVDPNVPFYWTEGGPDINDPNYAVAWTQWGKIFTEAMNNWCRGLITWNLMLDQKGNPNIGPFQCGGLVTVKPDSLIVESGQYWALRHFSQHVKREAVRIASHSDASELMHIAFRNPDGSRALVVTNTGAERVVAISEGGSTAKLTLPADCISTMVWPAPSAAR
jgi:glucosylceramidase